MKGTPGPGESRLRAALRRWRPVTRSHLTQAAKSEFEIELVDWMHSIEKRLTRLERIMAGGSLVILIADIVLRVLDKLPAK